jgi:hypothetical protein
MKKLLKLNPNFLIGTGLMGTNGGIFFFDASSDIGLGITLLGSSIAILGVVIFWINSKK